MYSRDRFFNDYTINFSKGNNLNNLVTLSHEYIHCLSCKYPEIKENTSAYTKYTEMLSELGELKFLDFLTDNLENNKNIDLYKKSYRARYNPILDRFLFVQPLLDLYLSKVEFIPEKFSEFYDTKFELNVKFTIEEIENLLKINSYYRTLGRDRVIKKLNSMTKKENIFIENQIDRLEQYVDEYKHILGLGVASFLHQKGISSEEFVQLIEIINTVETDEFEKLLPKMSEDDLVYATKKEYCYKR